MDAATDYHNSDGSMILDVLAKGREAYYKVVGWPPVSRNERNALTSRGKFVKVAVAGAPYQRKVDLEAYAGYDQLLAALQDKFTSHFTVHRRVGNGEMALVDVVSGAEYVPMYEDKDGDWMLVGDVPGGKDIGYEVKVARIEVDMWILKLQGVVMDF